MRLKTALIQIYQIKLNKESKMKPAYKIFLTLLLISLSNQAMSSDSGVKQIKLKGIQVPSDAQNIVQFWLADGDTKGYNTFKTIDKTSKVCEKTTLNIALDDRGYWDLKQKKLC